NFPQVVMRLGELWFEPGRLQIMRLCFRQVALYEKRTREIDMSIDQTRINPHSLPILRNCLLELPLFFQEGAIAMPGERGLWFYPDGSFAFRRRFIEPASFLQSGGVIEMRPRTNRKIGDDRGETFELTPRDAHLPEPECPQGNDKNSHPFRAVQGPTREKTICRNVGCAAADAERLSS